MFAVLLLAVRMRVTWLTQGKGDPPAWMQMWTYCATYAVMLMTLIVVAIPLVTGEVIGVVQKTGDLNEHVKLFDNFEVICITYGAVTFVPPAGTGPDETIPPPAPAVACTMIIACMFFWLTRRSSFREHGRSSQARSTRSSRTR